MFETFVWMAALASASSGRPAAAHAQHTAVVSAAPRITANLDVEYGRAAGESLRLDLYLPSADEPASRLRPGVLFIHGGGWSGGDKSEYAAYGRELAGRGYVAASANYRLAPKHHFPSNVIDVQSALRWLRQHAAEYRLDPERIGVMGASAGGHLASMLGVLPASERQMPEADRTLGVQCVVDYFGRMDLTLEPTGGRWTDFRPDYIGKKKAEALELWQQASPINHVSSRTPPFLLIHGSADQQVQPAQSEIMFERLQKAGVESYLLILAGQGHGFRGAPAQQAWDFAKVFLDRHLKR